MKPIIYLSILLVITSCSAPKIVDKPINFNEQRKELSLKYMKEHYGLDQKEPTIDPKMIVLHWTAIPTFEASFNAFKDPLLPSSRTEIADASSLNVSAQFLVDRDGTIYRLMPETTMARHVIGLNHSAIGIENVGGTKDTPLTPEQLKANIELVRYLKGKYDIEYLIGHFEYQNFENSDLWLEKDKNYRTAKTDPGREFMAKVRRAVKDLGFKTIPQVEPINAGNESNQ
ncbi:MAG: peptidoglycan recognition family protein [Salegentibacter sp.]